MAICGRWHSNGGSSSILNARFRGAGGVYNIPWALKTPGIYGMPKTVLWTFFFFNQKILSFACLLHTHTHTRGASTERWSFYNFHILNILHTHVSSSTHFSPFILLNSSRYIFLPPHHRAAVVVAGPNHPLFTSHAIEAIKAIATIAGILHPATPERMYVYICICISCDPVYKTIKRKHTFIPSKK